MSDEVTREDLATELKHLREDFAQFREELHPVIKAYAAATIGARALKWVVSVLAAIGGLAVAVKTILEGAPHPPA